MNRVNGFLCLISTLAILVWSDADAASSRPVKARHGMVVSAESLATDAGVEILKKGGNAIDAAVAVGFMLAVTYPEAGNIGGGGFMVLRLSDGRTTMIDFREKAPAAATRDMFLNELGVPVERKSTVGPLAAGVPGTTAGLLLALEKYGTRSRAEVMRNAIMVAEKGFVVDERLAKSFQDKMTEEIRGRGFRSFPSSVRTFTRNGEVYAQGEFFRQPDLASTLEMIRDRGPAGFYEGPVAELIVAEMERSGGIISLSDLASYKAVEREPVKGSYRGYDIISAAPPSAGGTIILEMLNILERFDLQASGPHSSRTVHLFAAAAQRAFADRCTYMGDPDQVAVPTRTLLSKDYATSRAASIDASKAMPSSAIGAGAVRALEGHQTTHYCTADSQGNVVSVTVTLNDAYGCKTAVGGAGFFLNSEMDDFVAKPGVPNADGLVGSEANSIAPGKRMLSSMSPTIVLKGGSPFMVLGARGSGRIPTAVAQIIINVIDFGMNIQEAVDAPRVHHQWLPDTLRYEPRSLLADVLDNLRRMGYATAELERPNAGLAEALLVDSGTGWFYGGPDPREEGTAAGF
jgi:gamma-glutamyltranspeptidase/glutathione hydrolase